MRKEEKTRQETYAKNREKAKEFQKVIQFVQHCPTWSVLISPGFYSE